MESKRATPPDPAGSTVSAGESPTRLSVPREPVEGVCEECGAEALRRYPVVSEGGWFVVVKCQSCLASMTRERGPRLGPVRLLEDGILK